MLLTILLLTVLFLVGFLASYFPKKKIMIAWFQSLSSPHVVAASRSVDEEKEAVKKKTTNSSTATTAQNKVELKRVFATFDKNNDGYITRQELKESLKNIGMFMEDKDVADMVAKVDANGDGLIDLDEFCELFESLSSRDGGINGEEGHDRDHQGQEDDKEDYLKEAFDVFDGDKDGLITVEELGSVLSSLGFREGMKLEDCKEMIKKVDVDGDGMVNFDEFKRMMRSGERLIPVC